MKDSGKITAMLPEGFWDTLSYSNTIDNSWIPRTPEPDPYAPVIPNVKSYVLGGGMEITLTLEELHILKSFADRNEELKNVLKKFTPYIKVEVKF